MKFSCDQCHAQYMIADEKVGPRGVKVKCKKCGNVIVVKPAADAAPAPSESTAPAHSGASTESTSAPASGGEAFGSLFGISGSAAPSGGGGLDAGVVGGGFGSAFGAPPAEPTPAAAAPVAASSAPGFMAGSGFPSTFGNTALAGAYQSESTTDFKLNALDPASAPARRPAGEKEWYVAVEDSQIGPVDLSEIEQRWDGKELDEDSLAWKTGMGDWMPIAEIPELAYLITQRPQAKPRAAAVAASPSASSAPSAAAPAGLGPVSFGGGGNGASEAVSWKPSAASALSSLVQEELVAAAAPKPAAAPSAPPSGVPDLGMPGFGAGDLFAAGSNGSAAPAPAPRADPFAAAPAPAWSVPVVPRQSGGSKWMVPVFGVLGVAILALLGLVVYQVFLKPAPRQVQQVVAQPTAPVPAPTPPTQVAQAPTPPAPAPAPAPSAAPEPRTPPAKHKPAREVERENAREAPPPPRERPKPAATGGDPLDNIPSGGGDVKEALTKADVMDGIKKNAAAVAPCLKEARSRNEIQPKSWTFVLDWTIKPSGAVANPVLKGPPEVMGTSLPSCFATAMRRWSFPASKKETPVSNFPFGPVNIR